jgi:hypothetical protein
VSCRSPSATLIWASRAPDGRGYRTLFRRSHTIQPFRWHEVSVASVIRSAVTDLLFKAAAMAHDHEDLHDLEQPDGRELRDLVKEQLASKAVSTSPRSRCMHCMGGEAGGPNGN